MLGSACFDLHHADHPCYFTVGINRAVFCAWGVSSTKKVSDDATTLLGAYTILISGFYGDHVSTSENAPIWASGLSYKTVYHPGVGVLYLMGMMRNMRKIQQAQSSSEPTGKKTLIQKLRSVPPVLIPLVISTWINR